MNFFEAQEKARKQTFWLLVIFALMVGVLSFFNAILVGFSIQSWKDHFWPVFLLSSFFFITAAWIQYLKIRNGSQIATLMGGVPLVLPTENALEKRLYNIVEEMSIASGVPVPRIYILRGEMGINAFVAGLSSYSVVLAVTEGAIKTLNRDELQSVVGHEFSHILNEDVSLNVKLAGIVTGFYMFVRIGDFILNGTRRSRDKESQNLGLLGVGFMALGSVGYIFGQLLQSMISRQREFLADASSAQFTRNPESLASALAIIQKGPGSEMRSAYKHEMSHFFFAQGATGFLSRMFSTHPPVAERIRRLAPNFKLENFECPVAEVSIFAPQDLDSYTIKNISGGQIHSAESAKASLFAVLLGQQSEDLQEKVLSHLAQEMPSQKREIESLMTQYSSLRGNQFNNFKLALGFLSHGTNEEKNDFLTSIRILFEMDTVVDFREGLFYIIARNTLNESLKNPKVIKDLRELKNLLGRWIPWILADATAENKELLKNLALKKFELVLSFEAPSVPFSWAGLVQDTELLARLDMGVRKKLSLFLKEVFQAQGINNPKLNEDILLLSWALQVPARFLQLSLDESNG